MQIFTSTVQHFPTIFSLSTKQTNKINYGCWNLRDGVSYFFLFSYIYRVKQWLPFACKRFFNAVFTFRSFNIGKVLHCDRPIILLTRVLGFFYWNFSFALYLLTKITWIHRKIIYWVQFQSFILTWFLFSSPKNQIQSILIRKIIQ